jgi:hypothetical protein
MLQAHKNSTKEKELVTFGSDKEQLLGAFLPLEKLGKLSLASYYRKKFKKNTQVVNEKKLHL